MQARQGSGAELKVCKTVFRGAGLTSAPRPDMISRHQEVKLTT